MTIKTEYEISACLASLRGMGAQRINFWCVSEPCRHHSQVNLMDLLRRHGGLTTLVSLARAAKCKNCGRKGVHVDVMWTPNTTEPETHGLKVIDGGRRPDLQAFPKRDHS